MSSSSPAFRLLDPLAFSSAWVASAALSLCLASARAMGGWPEPAVPALAFCGTLVVYNVDRLRDLPRDRTNAPLRSAFVERHRRGLVALTAAAAVACAPLALLAGPGAVALLLPVLLAGLLHRRLKHHRGWKPFYVSAAWALVVVGVPAATLPAPHHVGWVAACIGATLLANVIASNLRDGEALLLQVGPGAPLHLARGFALLGLLLGALAPPAVRPLLWVPLATLLALAFFRAEERYGLVVVDGALLLGSLLALPGPFA